MNGKFPWPRHSHWMAHTKECIKMCDHEKIHRSRELLKLSIQWCDFQRQKWRLLFWCQIWPSKCQIWPSSQVTKYQRGNFPHKRPPQNVWPSKIFQSPKNLLKILSVRSGQTCKLPSIRGVISLTKDRHKMCGPPKFFKVPEISKLFEGLELAILTRYSYQVPEWWFPSQKTATKYVALQNFSKSQKMLYWVVKV